MTDTRNNGGKAADADREAFEWAYAAQANKHGMDCTVESVTARRIGGGYGDRPYLNGAWDGWKLALTARSPSSKEA